MTRRGETAGTGETPGQVLPRGPGGPGRPLRLVVLGSAAGPHDANRTAVFARLGHDVTMLSMTAADIPGVRVLPVLAGSTSFKLLRRLVQMAGMIRAIRAHAPDIWHAHYAAEYGTWAAALLRRRPLVVTVMGGDVLFDEQGSQGRLGRALTRFALRRADLVLVKSNALGEVVESFGVARDRILRVIWGIDLSRFKADAGEVQKLRAEWEAEGRLVLLAPRMLQPFYNHQLLIGALPRIVAGGHDAIVVFSLKGAHADYRAEIEALATRLGVADRLRFAPSRAPEAMASLYASADVVVSLAPSDGMPQTPIEAGAVERPTVMTDLARYRELFTDGENVVLTSLDEATIAERISGLLASEEQRIRVAAGANGVMREHAELSSEARRVEAAYYALVAARQGGG